MLVVSFRSEEVGPGHMLRRLKPSAHLRLATFGAAEVARMAESMAGALPPEATELVARLSEGNPFMASAVLHGLVEDGALVPGPEGWQVEPDAMAHVRSSRQAASFLVRRLKRLPADSLRLLSVGAVLGKSFDLERVAALSGAHRDRVAAALAEPRRRHMLWEDSRDRYTFVHDKLREALLGLMLPEERKELHRLAARRHRQQPSGGPLRAGLPLRRRGRVHPGAALRAGGGGAGPAAVRPGDRGAQLPHRRARRGGRRHGHPLPHRRGAG